MIYFLLAILVVDMSDGTWIVVTSLFLVIHIDLLVAHM